jgi:hypothetical protein
VRDLLARRHELPPGQCRRALDDLVLFAIWLHRAGTPYVYGLLLVDNHRTQYPCFVDRAGKER